MKSSFKSSRAFTLIEVLVASAVLIMLMGMIAVVTGQISKVWRNTDSKIDSFRGARLGMSVMNRVLSQATLNSYSDYFSLKNNRFCNTVEPADEREAYRRRSELHFISGNAAEVLKGAGASSISSHAIFFQAPLGYTEKAEEYGGLGHLLNACGFYVEYSQDVEQPDFLKLLEPARLPRYRYRLMMMMQPTEFLKIYGDPKTLASSPRGWFVDDFQKYSRPIAENVIAMVVLCKRPNPSSGNQKTAFYLPVSSEGNSYLYDSRTAPGDNAKQAETSNQLPPLVQVTLVSIDEKSAQNISEKSGEEDPKLVPTTLFQSPENYEKDMKDLEDILKAKPENTAQNTIPCQYRIYSFDILIRSSSWNE
ncbi:MAG: Verru_Chthon cassette protein C [Verrucomicrobiota bacterium]